MKDYYQILGVDRSANEHQIKKAYRKLAMRHHPDHSDSPDANDILVEINEAYDVLGDLTKKAGYDFLFNEPSYAWMYAAAETHEEEPQPTRREARVVVEEEKEYVPPIDWAARPWYKRLDCRDKKARLLVKALSKWFIYFILTVVADFFLPYVTHVEPIEQVRYGSEFNGGKVTNCIFLQVRGREYSIPEGETKINVKAGEKAILESTPILRTPRYMYLYRDQIFKVWAFGTFYDSYIFILVMLAVVAALGVESENNADQALKALILGCLTFSLLLVLWMI